MKKMRRLLPVVLQLITILVLYLSFYSRIESKPNHVGFWLILALGMSIGVALTHVILLVKEKDKS